MEFLLEITLLTKTQVDWLGSWNFIPLPLLSMAVFILVRYLPLFYLSFDRFGNIMCEIESNWASMEHGLNYLKWVEWHDNGNELHGLTLASFPSWVLKCIVANSHNTWIRYLVKLEDRSVPGEFHRQNLTAVHPDFQDRVTSECGLAVPCQSAFFHSWQPANMKAAIPGKSWCWFGDLP